MRTLKQLAAVSSMVWISFVVCGQDLQTRKDANPQAGMGGTVDGMDRWTVSGEDHLVKQSFWIREGDRNAVPPDVSATQLRTETTEIWPKGGRVLAETTFRGQERIMVVNYRSNHTTRALLLHGEVRYIEADGDGDGHFESVMLPGGEAGGSSVFRRGRDGGLTPLSDAELRKLGKKARRASEMWKAGRTSEMWLWSVDDLGGKVEPGVALEPPPAAAVREAPETMDTKPKSEAPADGGGR